jgi:hypothetical protein
VNPRSNGIDAHDDTGKAGACHHELIAAREISQHVVVLSVAPHDDGGGAAAARALLTECA